MEKYLSKLKSKKKQMVQKSYRVYSKILKDHIWIVQSSEAQDQLLEEGVTEAIYLQDEIKDFIDAGLTKQELLAGHKLKKAFMGSVSIEDCISEEKEKDSSLCPKCGQPGKRYCFGDTGNGKYDYGMFCLKCEPYNE